MEETLLERVAITILFGRILESCNLITRFPKYLNNTQETSGYLQSPESYLDVDIVKELVQSCSNKG